MSVFRLIAKLNDRTTHVEVSAAGSLDAGSTPAVSIHKPFSLMVKGFLFLFPQYSPNFPPAHKKTLTLNVSATAGLLYLFEWTGTDARIVRLLR